MRTQILDTLAVIIVIFVIPSPSVQRIDINGIGTGLVLIFERQ